MPRKKNEKYKKWVDAVNATPAHIVSALQNDGRLCDDPNCPVKRGHSAALDSLWKLTEYGYADGGRIRQGRERGVMNTPLSGAFADVFIIDEDIAKEHLPVFKVIEKVEETEYLVSRYSDNEDVIPKIKITYDGKELDNVVWDDTHISIKTIKEKEYYSMSKDNSGDPSPNHPFSRFIKDRRPIIFDPPPIGSIVSDIGIDVPKSIYDEEKSAGKIERPWFYDLQLHIVMGYGCMGKVSCIGTTKKHVPVMITMAVPGSGYYWDDTPPQHWEKGAEAYKGMRITSLVWGQPRKPPESRDFYKMFNPNNRQGKNPASMNLYQGYNYDGRGGEYSWNNNSSSPQFNRYGYGRTLYAPFPMRLVSTPKEKEYPTISEDDFPVIEQEQT